MSVQLEDHRPLSNVEMRPSSLTYALQQPLPVPSPYVRSPKLGPGGRITLPAYEHRKADGGWAIEPWLRLPSELYHASARDSRHLVHKSQRQKTCTAYTCVVKTASLAGNASPRFVPNEFQRHTSLRRDRSGRVLHERSESRGEDGFVQRNCSELVCCCIPLEHKDSTPSNASSPRPALLSLCLLATTAQHSNFWPALRTSLGQHPGSLASSEVGEGCTPARRRRGSWSTSRRLVCACTN
ncbi:hypothetical protein PsYK624_108280 [Phanerochaete sordida]|uniref:Uncharacterized protein n=1 Tax=Phanerochaete sordida TaxID=48140 RepID=A0A9P3GFD2_9APHY|nr:hypothetical protein PsYK624_108280 [Phanerochaete sordida]